MEAGPRFHIPIPELLADQNRVIFAIEGSIATILQKSWENIQSL